MTTKKKKAEDRTHTVVLDGRLVSGWDSSRSPLVTITGLTEDEAVVLGREVGYPVLRDGGVGSSDVYRAGVPMKGVTVTVGDIAGRGIKHDFDADTFAERVAEYRADRDRQEAEQERLRAERAAQVAEEARRRRIAEEAAKLKAAAEAEQVKKFEAEAERLIDAENSK